MDGEVGDGKHPNFHFCFIVACVSICNNTNFHKNWTINKDFQIYQVSTIVKKGGGGRMLVVEPRYSLLFYRYISRCYISILIKIGAYIKIFKFIKFQLYTSRGWGEGVGGLKTIKIESHMMLIVRHETYS